MKEITEAKLAMLGTPPNKYILNIWKYVTPIILLVMEKSIF